MNWRTPLARAVYWSGGQIARIKYPQRTYTIEWSVDWDHDIEAWDFDRDGDPWTFVPSERVWLPHPWGIALGFHVAHRIDPCHYDHWALNHSGHASRACPECPGRVCAIEEDGSNHGFT